MNMLIYKNNETSLSCRVYLKNVSLLPTFKNKQIYLNHRLTDQMIGTDKIQYLFRIKNTLEISCKLKLSEPDKDYLQKT